ncbi:MAG TPA: LysR family transcriptional regulator [Candidatus Acidoferrum sp.]|jgi:DNA-binding transcriptional LysR family regulator|nr:LysR family transcriptional regulator [Candidatus Acidoferrum sp.]
MNVPRGVIRELDMMAAPLSLRELRTCVAVATHGSASRAAEALGYAQSTVTLHLQNVEASLGVPLFERRGKRLVLTDAGRRVADDGRALLEQADALRARALDAAAAPGRRVGVGALEPMASCQIPPLVGAYRRREPQVQVEVHVGGTATLIESLRSGQIDFAIVGRPLQRRADIAFSPLFTERFVVLVPPHHRLAGATKTRLRDLAHESLLVSDETCVYRALVAGAIEDGDVDVMLQARFGTVANLPHAVAAGLGVAVVPSMQTALLPAGVRAIPLADPRLSVTIGIITTRGGAGTPAARAFRAFAEAQLRESPRKR